MSIQIDKLRIAGFRGISDLEINLPRVTVLIGTNNSGKTSVIKALQLALGDYSRYLQEEDFHIDNNDQKSDKILVDVRIIPIGEDGRRTKKFNDEWSEEFGDKIQAEIDENQFLAIRTECLPDIVKGGFTINRYSLDNWEEQTDWKNIVSKPSKRIRSRFESLPFISIDAQRDIHQELKEKSSYIGKVLSSIKYDKEAVEQLEKMLSDVNKEALDKSESLTKLKENLDALSDSFQGSGQTEITPFPKKIRDLSKKFSVHFGESEQASFSMEYHGMGTRSWASMLTVKALIDVMAKNYKEEVKPFFPIIAAEEPEAHLHPNAQRTLYQQLVSTKGQIIISTHSPYLAALANQNELRNLFSSDLKVTVNQLNENLEPEDKRKIQREVIHSRGELLFSKAIVLSEGETEEQVLPQLFAKYFGKEPFSLGINFIGVSGSGAKYRPFLNFANDFKIPVFIFSDGETKTIKELKKNYSKVFGETNIIAANNITILEGTDFEGYLFEEGFSDIIEDAIKNIGGNDFLEKWIEKKDGSFLSRKKTNRPICEECKQYIYQDILRDYKNEEGRKRAMKDILDSKKPMYAQAVTEELCKLEKDQFPNKIKEFFEKIKNKVSL